MADPRPSSEADPETVLRADPVMAGVIDRREPHPLDLEGCEFERLCVTIINQQLSTASARAVRERAFEVLGTVTPETVLETPREPLREAGLSRTKVDYVKNAARAFQNRDLTRAGLADHTNDEVLAELTRITGVGEWTARMYCIFVLGRPDVLPLGDLAVRRGIERLYNDGEALTRGQMREIAEPWRPYRSLATRYIWAEYEA